MAYYDFRCDQHGVFEVKQEMLQVHRTVCPKCGEYAQRIYTPVIHYWPDVLWNKDGSKQSPDELPSIPTGTKWTHGWTPKEKEAGGN